MMLALALLAVVASAHVLPGNPPAPIHSRLQADGPEQLWINYGQRPDQMVFSWVTSGKAASIVQYDLVPHRWAMNATGSSTSYTFGFYTSGSLHHAIVNGLKQNTTYYYRVGDPSAALWSDMHTFVSHPGVGANVTHTFGVVGDLGQTIYSNGTIQHMMANAAIDSIIHPGDLAYSDGDAPRWDSWRRLTQPLSASIPWHVAAGNHEIDFELFPKFAVFKPYQMRFRMPFTDDRVNATRNLFYSYNVGGVHVLALNSYFDYMEGSDQYEFAKADLEAIDRSKTPWTVVLVHVPFYNSNKQHQHEGDPMRDLFEPMFYGKVDVVFAGHVHAYERCSGVYQGHRDDHAPVYITIGDGGNREGLYDNWISPTPEWSLFRAAQYGHGALQVNRTTMVWSWHDLNHAEPVKSDEFVLRKS